MKQGDSLKLMRAMGATTFDPMPPDQHKWQMAKSQPPLIRIWSWLCAHTIHWNGQERSAFAIDREGHDLTIERLAKDLGFDAMNARHYWKAGTDQGLWRNGTKEEGRRRLYLCGKVVAAKPDQPADQEIGMYIPMPDQILKKTKGWPEAKLQEFRAWWNEWAPVRKEVRDTAIAELVGVTRSILDRDDDTALLTKWGIEPNRQEHKNGKSPEEAAARQARAQSLEPVLDRYVQTLFECVQTSKNEVYKPLVQSETAGASLLPSENYQRRADSGAVRQVLNDSPPNGKTPSQEGEKSPKQLPMVSKPGQQKPTEQEAAMFAGLRKWQKEHPRSVNFGEEITIHNKGQLATVRKMVANLRGEVDAFLVYSEAKIAEVKPAMGKRAGMGLVVEWVGDFMRGAAERTASAEKFKKQLEAEAAKNKRVAREQREHLIIAARATLEDPTASARDCEMAREVLDANGAAEGGPTR